MFETWYSMKMHQARVKELGKLHSPYRQQTQPGGGSPTAGDAAQRVGPTEAAPDSGAPAPQPPNDRPVTASTAGRRSPRKTVVARLVTEYPKALPRRRRSPRPSEIIAFQQHAERLLHMKRRIASYSTKSERKRAFDYLGHPAYLRRGYRDVAAIRGSGVPKSTQSAWSSRLVPALTAPPAYGPRRPASTSPPSARRTASPPHSDGRMLQSAPGRPQHRGRRVKTPPGGGGGGNRDDGTGSGVAAPGAGSGSSGTKQAAA